MAEKKKAENGSSDKGKFFVVITEFKEIFAGWSSSDPKDDLIVLNNVRMVVYYGSDTKGLVGLASNGPSKDSRLSNECPQIVIRKPVNVLLASDAAIEKFGNVIWK